MSEPTALKQYELVRWDGTTTVYLGYHDAAQKWYIKKIVVSTGVITYVKGETLFSTNWDNRASLTYAEYNEVF